LRVQGITRQHVRDALWKDRTLVKTYGLRSTLHLFPTQELGQWLAALRAKVPHREPNQVEVEALPPDRRAAVVEAIRDALDGRPLTREELGLEIERRVGAWATKPVFPAFGGQWPGWQLGLRQAALEGILAFGPSQGARVTYVRLDQWVGELPEVDGATALREVCRRYLAAYGPATHVEFARWFSTPPRAALELMRSMGDALTEVDVEGWRAWLPTGVLDADEPLAASAGRVHLVPQFDCYVVGSFPRQRLIPPSAPPELQRGTAAPYAVMLVDGVIAGLWERRKRGRDLEIRVGPFSSLDTAMQEQVEQQAQRIGEILETKVVLSFGDVQPRGHL
jgi:hypothetical protein